MNFFLGLNSDSFFVPGSFRISFFFYIFAAMINVTDGQALNILGRLSENIRRIVVFLSDFKTKNLFNTIDQPPYISDLARCDFFRLD